MRVLLINPGNESSGMPHYGLAMLGAVIKEQGHQVRVADYQCSDRIPPLPALLLTFQPDVIGVSAISALQGLISETFDVIRNWSADAPIICGGPHASCYARELAQDGRIDYVVVGEAEAAIGDLIKHSARQPSPQIVAPELPDLGALPLPDYRIFYDFKSIRFQPLVSSRGCPYGCIFCAVHATNSKKWRARTIADCLHELVTVSSTLPGVRTVVIWDDNFSLDLARGKRLIQAYLDSGLSYPLRPANMRADRADEELIQLLKRAHCEEIQLGAEHGDPAVFAGIHKGETLDDIRRAGRIVKENDMRLVLSFIIGLPGDNVRKTLASVRLARQLDADYCYWNILVPYQGTKVHRHFQVAGRIDESRLPPKTWMPAGQAQEPNADTPDFSAAERLEARRIAEILSGQTPLDGQLGFLCASALRHGFPLELLALLAARLKTSIALPRRRRAAANSWQAAS